MSITIHLDREVMSDVRPWGSWEVLDLGPDYKVKRITVRPHSRLSLQTHAHRSEYWLIVAGTATCIVGERQVLLSAGESIHVPLGAPHRIGNHEDDEHRPEVRPVRSLQHRLAGDGQGVPDARDAGEVVGSVKGDLSGAAVELLQHE